MKNRKKFISAELNMTACISCKYLLKENTCEAFPEGIPKAIWEAENDHTKPFSGDNGIQYKKK